MLENDIPLYYTRHPRAVPHAANVFDFDTVKIFVAPDRKQEQYIDKRIIDLYDDLSPDLRTVAERLSTETTDDAARILRDILTQYDAKETADYLQSSLRDGTLCNYSEVVPKEHYESRDGRIETYAFYLKGILTSFGIIVERDEGCYCLLYDEDSDYSHALSFLQKTYEMKTADFTADSAKNKVKCKGGLF